MANGSDVRPGSGVALWELVLAAVLLFVLFSGEPVRLLCGG